MGPTEIAHAFDPQARQIGSPMFWVGWRPSAPPTFGRPHAVAERPGDWPFFGVRGACGVRIQDADVMIRSQIYPHVGRTVLPTRVGMVRLR